MLRGGSITLESDAKEIRRKLEDKYPFPLNLCKPPVKSMHARGYQIVMGRVYVDNYCNMGQPDVIPLHYWIYDPCSKRYCDITASQFNIHLSPGKKLPEIYIWSEGEKTIYIEERRELSPYEVL